MTDGTITDPTAYHRLRIREALGFDGEVSAADYVAVLSDLMREQGQDAVVLGGLAKLRDALLNVRDLCADGDRT
ncbi:hypothetical protein [Roseomonas indoligenes]|uniref:Uncharacterized protein n=1 Tax=Roseomonas indoligenes TaxID=2820811 RepID=A0A940N0Q9_9PROT|nr:hypothetical protein [Pararoseomonas indoligenes]MBP0492187.1 hypothetical protein [Pararoseomonas indoligenes]